MQPETFSKAGHPAATAAVCLRAAAADDLDAVNRVVQQSVDTWRLPVRVRRLTAPSLNYSRSDLAHMDLVLALDPGATRVVWWPSRTPAPQTRRRVESALLLHGLYVTPDEQHRGIGTRLLDAALRAAVSRGLGGVVVRAWRDAEGFFTARGFRRLGCRRRRRTRSRADCGDRWRERGA